MRFTSILAAFALLAIPTLAQADDASPASASSTDPQVTRLLQAKKTLKWNYTPAGRAERYGHAEALVAASADQVAKTARDFGHYRELHRKFATARIIGKEGDNTDVYMRYPVKIGPMNVEFYEVMRFGKTAVNGNMHILEGRGVKGDMKQGHTVITVKAIDPTHSLLQVDILLVPSLPAPQSMIDEELRDGALDFVNGLKDRAQGWVGDVTSLGPTTNPAP